MEALPGHLAQRLESLDIGCADAGGGLHLEADDAAIFALELPRNRRTPAGESRISESGAGVGRPVGRPVDRRDPASQDAVLP